MNMKATYYTVAARCRTSGQWGAQFGSYDREDAKDEAEDMRRSGVWSKIKIVRSGDTQADIIAAVDDLNNG